MSSPNDPATRRYVCPDCDKAFSTSSHLGRHSRVHTGEKNYKCSFPGCETRCSRLDNLQAHQRIHLTPQPRTKSRKSGSSRSGVDTNTSPPSSSASSSPPEMFRSPTSRFSSVSATNSPQPLMSPQLPPSSTPHPSLPLYDGYSSIEDQFNPYVSMQNSPPTRSRAGVSSPHMPYPRGLPSPIVRGSPDDALDAFNSSTLFQNAAPMQRRSNMYQPHPSAFRGPSNYPYNYPPSMPQYPTSAPPPRVPLHTPSPTSSDFPDLNQLPRYYPS
ncbi:hypothetical protein C8R44DRAFT_437520 [Mycena epipterygia]|nr:hypothetical protein C8R44DRAFT_437520 [Mycena epipterygia]